MSRAAWLVVLLPAALVLSRSRAAHACTPPLCSGGTIVPSDQDTVPASFPGIYWRPLTSVAGGAADPTKVHITAGVEATPVPFTVMPLGNGGFLLVPDAPLAVGTSYRVTDATTCEGSSAPALDGSFEVGPAADLPTTLGTLATSKQILQLIEVDTPSGSCVANATVAQSTITLTLDPATAAWGDLLQYQAIVDGQPWSREPVSIRGPLGGRSIGARVAVFQTCASNDPAADRGLASGSHQVQLKATLPGTSLTLESSPITVDVACPVAEPPPAGPPGDGASDGGCSASGSASLPWLGLVMGALVVRRARRRSAR